MKKKNRRLRDRLADFISRYVQKRLTIDLID